ncbi:STAS domain-containing protein [Nocardia spumae]|uniref:STAS domain-containing protein n=1 Tax=Nocardia spumae TaxID=2887190 RepID=UPI001D14E194|nr:STAS domain-containing protein [Nocardia spumae]
MTAIAVVPHTTEFPATPDTPHRGLARDTVGPFRIVVHVEGEADVSVIGDLRHALEYAAKRARHAVVVDLRNTSFLGIRAAAVLAATEDTCRAAGIELHMVAGSRPVERVLEVVGVGTRSRVHSSMYAALRA